MSPGATGSQKTLGSSATTTCPTPGEVGTPVQWSDVDTGFPVMLIQRPDCGAQVQRKALDMMFNSCVWMLECTTRTFLRRLRSFVTEIFD